MDAKQFFDLIDNRPFEPFVIDLVNGRSVVVEDPDRVLVAPGRQKVKFIYVFSHDQEDWTLFSLDGITAYRALPRDGKNAG